MVRYRSDGTLSWATRAVSDPESEARDVTFDPAGALLTTGFFYGELVLGEEPAAVSLAGSGTSFNDRDGFLARLTVHESEPDPAEQVAAVQDTLAGMAVHHGIANALNSKLTSALAALQRGDTPGVCGPLGAFLNQVAAQVGKKLTAGQAHELTALVTQIRTQLGC